ncbi:hypothetical protein O181_123887 [Austropuccinia psidii MF-1]|uniref:Uncharacterized protein n=1 Tax=Austropuccinia psidii MF-1 TaxID=1389203 RepID=A0A9Q3KNK4_9BASI|nr:hypothetical protein [Austropuccinia psidii MF-1]
MKGKNNFKITEINKCVPTCYHQSESRVNRWLLTSHCTACQDNVNRHMCHMRMSLKAQTHFNTIRDVQMRVWHCPPISVLTTPYAFTPLPLPSLCSRGALPTCL